LAIYVKKQKATYGEIQKYLLRDAASSDVKKNLDEVQQVWSTAEFQIRGHPQNEC
jgi:hypothetical protein